MTQRQKIAWASVISILLLAWLSFNGGCDDRADVPSIPRATATPSGQATQIQPTPTLDPAVRIERAHLALHDGDYEAAIALFQESLVVGDGAVRQQLLLPLTRAYFGAGRHGELVALWTPSDLEALTVADRAVALGLVARSYEALGEWKEAISAYERYLELNDAAAYLMRLRMAEAYEALDEPEKAVQQLQAVDLTDLDAPTKAEILEELAGLLTELEDHESALAAYDQILSFAQVAYYRSVILWRKGQLLVDMGRQEEGVAVLHQVLQEYPHTWGAYAALLALDEIEAAEISLLLRGEILYYAEQYEQSIETLKRYRLANPYGFHSTAHFYAGLAYHAMGRYEEAIEEFDVVIRRFHWTRVVGDAWMAKARSLAALGGDPSELYREFATRYPAHGRAPEALWRAAVGLQRQGDWEQAGTLYGELQREYPDDSSAEEAGFREALAAYALGNYERARVLWERSLPAISSGTTTGRDGTARQRTRVLTWMGLASAGADEVESAKAFWSEAASLAPESYYGLRARDLMRGDSLRLPLDSVAEVAEFDLGYGDWRQIDEWVQSWAQTDGGLEGPVEDQALVRRAKALWELGWHDEAMGTYRQFRDEIVGDPQAILALAEHCYPNDVLTMVIACAERLISLGSSAAAAEPPAALWKLAYPTAYGHLVNAEAMPRKMDPLLFLALIRQESQFNPYVHSWAGAVGLAQVMPATGAWIAEKIGPESYEDALLLRPVVSVRYGVWYLAEALELFDGNWLAALAAYNAGWTNVAKWTGGEPIDDPDLFYETTPFTETKAYVRLVYENYRAYQTIYRQQRAARRPATLR
jgi:soluble lytic murein transglycosylase